MKKLFVVTSGVRGEVCGRHQKHAPLSVVRLIVEFLFLSIPPLHHTRAVTKAKKKEVTGVTRPGDRLVGLVVKVFSWREAGFGSRLHRGSFSRSSHLSDLNIGTPVKEMRVSLLYCVC